MLHSLMVLREIICPCNSRLLFELIWLPAHSINFELATTSQTTSA